MYIHAHKSSFSMFQTYTTFVKGLTPPFVIYLFIYLFLGPHPWHMEVPRHGVELELHLPVYTTAMATPDPSCGCDLHCSSQQCQILNPLGGARD